MTSAYKKAIDIGTQHRDVFDWPDVKGVISKLEEEVSELKEEIFLENNRLKTYEEFSDTLFTLLQVARHLKIDPERSLDFANQKYELRFQEMLKLISKDSKNIQHLSLESLEKFWSEAKKNTAHTLNTLLSNHFSQKITD